MAFLQVTVSLQVNITGALGVSNSSGSQMYQAGCPNLFAGQNVQPFRHLLRARLLAHTAGQSEPPALVFAPPPTRTDCIFPAGSLAYNSSALQLVDRFRLEV